MDLKLKCAASIGDIDLIHFCIKHGANDWDWGLTGAEKQQNHNLIQFFKKQINNDQSPSCNIL